MASFFPFAPPDPSGDLLSGAASFALRSYLVECGSVDVAVDANAATLLAGMVSRVDITGTNWRSRKELTCRSLRMSVGEAALDPGTLVAERLIKLRRPSRGDAEIVFTAEDFANFLAHPLVTAAAQERAPRRRGSRCASRGTRERARGDDAGRRRRRFSATCITSPRKRGRESARVRYEMRPASARGKVAVVATSVTDATDATDDASSSFAVDLAAAAGRRVFFENLARRLVRRSAFVREHARRRGGRDLDLDLEVVGFPPPSSLGMI